MAEIDIGLGKSARRGFALDDVSIVPSRRTRDRDDVDLTWKIDAYRSALPVLAAPALGPGSTDGSAPASAQAAYDAALAAAPSGAVAVVDLEPFAANDGSAPDLKQTVADLKAAGVRVAARCIPKHARELTGDAIAAEADLLVIQADVLSAEHVSSADDALNLKTYIRDLDIPVLVGGCASEAAALHLMRTGAAGVLVGVSRPDLGVGVPLATAIADGRSARVRHLDETGVHCHVIALGAIRDGADLAKAIVCGADAAMVDASLLSDGSDDLVDSLRRAMGVCGYTDLKSFQKAEVTVR